MYVVALLVIPLTAVGWFSIREVERNDRTSVESMSIARAVSATTSATAARAPLEVERVASLAMIAAETDERVDADFFERLRDETRPAVDRRLDELDAVLSVAADDDPAAVLVLRQAVAMLDAERDRVDDGTSNAADVQAAFGLVIDQVDGVITDSAAVFSTVDFGSASAVGLAHRLELTVAVVRTGCEEFAASGAEQLTGSQRTSRSEPSDVFRARVRHDDALEQALLVDPDGIRGLLAARDDVGTGSTVTPTVTPAVTPAMTPTMTPAVAIGQHVDYLRSVDELSAATDEPIATAVDAWAVGARSRNQNALLLLIGVGTASLLFGLVVMRSFASPLTRLRLQAERISRGELNAVPLRLAGPSDVRKVTGAINDMASTLSLVEDHMDALALAEEEGLPLLDELPGHVGSTMRQSMERVVALTARLQSSEARLGEEARLDNLTGLPNRFAVLEHLERVLTTLGSSASPDGQHPAGTTGVMFLDVDGFKSVNDRHGHAVGDVVLRDIAQRLRRSIRDDDFVARLGGDEFLVVVSDIDDASVLVGFGERMIGEIEQPYTVGDQLFAVSASVGATVIEHGDEPLSVIQRADAAVYQAKRRGRRRVEMFDKELQRSIEHGAELELALRQAIRHGELRMYLQPLADLATGLPSGAEALVRWERPGHGLVPPCDFIPIAERSGLIFELERWMLDAACRRVADWTSMGQGQGMRLAVNISGRHLIEGDLVADLDAALAATGADPNLLEIELTESQLLDDVERAITVLNAVRDRGVKVAIDDFGTGYSSMTYLQKLPVDIVKIDRSFISRATTNEFDSTIVDTIVTIGRTLSLEIVAEGIETAQQLAYVIDKGVTMGQGYLLARPQPALDAESVIFNGPLFDRDRVLSDALLGEPWNVGEPVGSRAPLALHP